MKHIFIINPKAGPKDISEYLINNIKNLFLNNEYEIHITTGTNDARDFAKMYCLQNPHIHKRFYSCGGDGTLNEVINGIYGAENVSLACYPSGSGNDFVKNFGDVSQFLSLENLVNGKVKKVDVLKFNGRYALNICNLGFDGEVAYNFNKFKRMPKVSGKTAYNLAVLYSLLSKMKHQVEITTEEGEIYNGYILLAAIANGLCYGGGFYCAPKAKVDDGIIDLVIVKKISRIRLLKFIKYYKRGTHLNNKKLSKYLIYKKCRKVSFVSKKELSLSYDGEVIRTKKLDFEILPQTLDFIIPSNL